MTPEDKLNALFGHAIEQQEAAKTAISDMGKERAQLHAAIEALKNTAGGLQKATGDAAGSAVAASLGQAQKDAQATLNAAIEALEIAAGKVTNAGAWITWQFALVFILTGVAAVATNYAIGRVTLPSQATVDALRSEQAELEANIADLAKRGGRIKLSKCGPQNRLCIQTTRNQGEGPGQTNFVGSWASADGKQEYVIPHGY